MKKYGDKTYNSVRYSLSELAYFPSYPLYIILANFS